ncbi:hypothetical protein IAT40_000472 [Kwoniella sp. CBS 6097]
MSSSFIFTYSAPTSTTSADTPNTPSSPGENTLSALSGSAFGGVNDKNIGVLHDPDHPEKVGGALSHLSIIFIVCGVVLFWMIAFIFIFWSVRRYQHKKELALHSTDGRRQTWHSQESTVIGSDTTSTFNPNPSFTASLTSPAPAPAPSFRPHKIRYPRSLPSSILSHDNISIAPLAQARHSPLTSTNSFSTDTVDASIITDVTPRRTQFAIRAGTNLLPPSPSPTSISFSSRTPLLAGVGPSQGVGSTRGPYQPALSVVEKPRSILKGSIAGSAYGSGSEKADSVYRAA